MHQPLKKQLLVSVLAYLGIIPVSAVNNTINIGGTEHRVDTLLKRDIGPGTTYMRLRLPSYPLNVNMVVMDMNNQYNRVETFQGQEMVGKTEEMEVASQRLSSTRHKVTAGANGNFWCVPNQAPWSDLLVGTTFGGNLRNGQIITETNAYSDQWCGGPAATCVIGADSYKNLWIEPMKWRGVVSASPFGEVEIIQVNKVVRENEIGLYNNYYPADKTFQPVNITTGSNAQHYQLAPGDAVEVYLNLVEGQVPSVGSNVRYRVANIRTDAGDGTRGTADAVLVARGGNAGHLTKLRVDDEITINHGWTSYTNGQTPIMENLIQGLSLCMKDGVKLPEGNNNSYNSTVYSRTGYGSSADNKKLYMIVIDKSVDPKYGASTGCNTDVMCDIAMHYGCANLSSVDAGGSAQMLILGNVVNKTTESNPRAVANGWFTYSVAPEDNEIARIEFDDLHLRVPPYSTSMPRVLGYNKYGDLIDDYVIDFTLACSEGVGKCDESNFIANKGGVKGYLTATYNGISTTRDIEVVETDVAMKLKPIYIDNVREYMPMVTSILDDKEFIYDPTELSWTVDDPEICSIDHHGMLRGIKNGTTTISCSLGEFTDQTIVNVQIAPAPKLSHDDWSKWIAKPRTGIKTISFENGLYTYKYSNIRAPQFDLNNQFTYYGLPDRLSVTFISSVELEKVECDLRTRNHTSLNMVTVSPPDGTTFAANREYTVDIPLPGEHNDLSTYPIEMRKISFYPVKKSAYLGDHTLQLIDVSAHYNNYNQGIGDVTADNYDDTTSKYYNLQGIQVIPGNLSPGVYILVSGSKAQKVLIK